MPVYISNEDYHGKSAVVPKDEYDAWRKIYLDALKEKRDAGSVCIYLVDGDSKGIDSLIVSKAATKDNLLKKLQAVVAERKAQPGAPVVPPTCQAGPPQAGPSELLLHLVSRSEKGGWGGFPAENWIILKDAEWKTWLPAAAQPGATYAIPDHEAEKVLTHFYPQTEICTFGKATEADGPYKHRIEAVSLKGKVLGVKAGKLQVRLDGNVKIKHTFYPNRDDDNYADSTLVGLLKLDQQTGRITHLALATTQGQYGRWSFHAAVVSEP